MPKKKKVALVLTGGGARASYQAGALTAIKEITQEMGIEQPFQIIVGNSAGSINAAFLAAGAHQWDTTVNELVTLWSNVTTKDIYDAGFWHLTKLGAKMLFELSTGSLFTKKKTVRALLETKPLAHMIQSHINFDQIKENIDKKDLHAFSIKAVNYMTGYSQTFFMGNKSIKEWKRTARFGIRETITHKHVCASTAIPILFPPVKINEHYFGDGSLRNNTPLSPAIKLGAEKVMVIAVSREMTDRFKNITHRTPSMARILSVLLNSVLLDAIDHDVERLKRINTIIDGQPSSGAKPIESCFLRPSQNVGIMASAESKNLPRTIRHLVGGLGTKREASDLVSYLLFEPAFTSRLIKLGYEDTMANKEEVYQFFSS